MKFDTTKLDQLREKFPQIRASEFRGSVRATVPPADLHAILQTLRDAMGLDLLVDVTCVDYLHYPEEEPEAEGGNGTGQSVERGEEERSGRSRHLQTSRERFGLVYLLASTVTNERLTVRTFVSDPQPTVRSAVDLWEGANWLEREVWDMFGIRFDGHPDLRRILLPEEFTAHPLRKDYPLQGRGERHNLPVLRRASTEAK